MSITKIVSVMESVYFYFFKLFLSNLSWKKFRRLYDGFQKNPNSYFYSNRVGSFIFRLKNNFTDKPQKNSRLKNKIFRFLDGKILKDEKNIPALLIRSRIARLFDDHELFEKFLDMAIKADPKNPNVIQLENFRQFLRLKNRVENFDADKGIKQWNPNFQNPDN